MKRFLKCITIILCVILVSCLFNITTILKDYADSEKEYEQLRTHAITKEEENPYKEIDWEALHELNPDIIGWIYIPDTVIDYPILKGERNDIYIRTTAEGQRKSAGSIFMESANNEDFSDKNTILYGHNMKNGTMFGGLKNFLNQEYLDSHQKVHIYTPEWRSIYQIYSVHTDRSTGTSYQIIPKDYGEWVKSMAEKTAVSASPADINLNTITLSACHGKSGSSTRIVVQLQKAP